MSLKFNIKKDIRSELPPSVPPTMTPVFCKISMKPTHEILNAYLKTYIYVWLINGSSFWMFPQRIYDNMLCGLIWSGDSWESGCFNIKLINSIY